MDFHCRNTPQTTQSPMKQNELTQKFPLKDLAAATCCPSLLVVTILLSVFHSQSEGFPITIKSGFQYPSHFIFND